jgi:hypothetical protein
MLHKEAVDASTLKLIRLLQQDSNLNDFYLVGGTALALQIGHRKSIDIDLFSQNSFDSVFLEKYLSQNYDFQVQFMHQNTLKGLINEIFVDMITHNYPLVDPVFIAENLRIAALRDIAAMKVNAIAGNGTRMKDFIDIYFLLKRFTFREIAESFSLKYSSKNEFHAIKSLTYFDDIDEKSQPVMLLEPKIKLSKVKETILKERDKFLNQVSGRK